MHTIRAVLDPGGTVMLRLLKNAESIQNLPNKIAGVLYAGSFLERGLIQCILSPSTNQTSFQSILSRAFLELVEVKKGCKMATEILHMSERK